jgi:hypothetical protein
MHLARSVVSAVPAGTTLASRPRVSVRAFLSESDSAYPLVVSLMLSYPVARLHMLLPFSTSYLKRLGSRPRKVASTNFGLRRARVYLSRIRLSMSTYVVLSFYVTVRVHLF